MSVVKTSDWVESTKLYNENPLKGLSLALHYAAMDGFDAFKDYLSNEFDKDSDKASIMLAGVYTEFLALFMHLLTCTSVDMFGRKDASKIKESLLPYIAEYATSYWVGDSAVVAGIIVRIANDAEASYARCKYYVSPKENSFQAVIDPLATKVQFDMRLAKVLGKDFRNPLDNVMIISCSSIGTAHFFSFIDLKEWLKGPAITLGIKNYESINLKPPGAK